MRYRYLKEHRDGCSSLKRACEALGVSRSGYYHYVRRRPSARRVEDELLSAYVKEMFLRHGGRYGAKRIALALGDEGVSVNHKRVSRLMRSMDLYAKGSGRRYRRCRRRDGALGRPNLLGQVFEAEGRNRIWVGDITYVPTGQGYLYLAVFMDVFSRKVTGWSMSSRMTDRLAVDAFLKGWGREGPPQGLVVHTDQGSQFTSGAFRAALRRCGATPSNSRKGNPYDNALMEAFYRTFKRELVDGAGFPSRELAAKEIFRYIELYYNNLRKHSSLGYQTPRQFERAHS